MKKVFYLLLLLPAAVRADSTAPSAVPAVAVFNLRSDRKVDTNAGVTNAGKAFASWLAHDLSVLPPITVVDEDRIENIADHAELDFDHPVAQAEAMQVGRSLGATSLVTGRIYESGADLIIAVKVVSAETGEALGTSVKGSTTTAFASMISQLSEQIGEIVLLQTGVKNFPWGPATIIGTRKLVSTIIPNIPREDLTGIVSIDGMPTLQTPDSSMHEQVLRPGAHALVIYYYEGSPVLQSLVIFDAKPGTSYAVVYDRSAPNGQRLGIEDMSTHQPIKLLDKSVWAAQRKDGDFSDYMLSRHADSPFFGGNSGILGGYPNTSPVFNSAPPASLSGGHK